MAVALKQNRIDTLITVPDKHDNVCEITKSELHNREQHPEIMSEQGTDKSHKDYGSIKQQFEQKLMEVLQEKKAAEDEAQRLAEEVTALRSVLEAHIDQIQAAQSAEDGEETAALKRELQLIKEQAEADISLLRNRLTATETNTATETEAGTASKELESLQKALALEKSHLESSALERSQLKQYLEARDREIEHLKVELEENRNEIEEVEIRRGEAETAQKQVEEALYRLQQQFEIGRQKSELEDDRHLQRHKTIDIGRVITGFSVRATMLGIFGCIMVAFGLFGVLTLTGDYNKINQDLLNNSADTANSTTRAKTEQIVHNVLRSRDAEPSSASKQIDVEEHASGSDRETIARTKSKLHATKVKPGTVTRDPMQSGGYAPAMVRVQGGVFTMGSHNNLLANEETPAHNVRINSFLIGQHEVTFKEYARFATSTGRSIPGDMGWGRGNRPVINVSWKSASAYAIWLSRETGKKYRLPTEAEWEYAAAGGTDTPYWWGYKLGKANANCFNCGSKWDGQSPAPVGSFKPNNFGIHNMAGNVMEWVQDCFHGNYNGAPEDGSAWLGADCSKRVARGGAYNKPGDSLRTTKRRGLEAKAKLAAIGFRVVQEL